jgi:hypothetical protein
MKNDKEQIESTVSALQEFVKEFGTLDDYTKLVMEVILEELFDKNSGNNGNK